jgi:signal transduction histidine kinase
VAGYRPVTVLSRCNPPDGIISTVKTGRTSIQPTLRALLSRPTVRWRLTLLYSLLFLICGAALLAITYWLFANFAISPPKEPLNPTMVQLQAAMSTVRANGLHRLQLYSGIALAIMTIVSVVLGWLLAGRVLAPLRTITATADRISDTNLHERLGMSGPRDELRLLADTIDRLLARLEAAFDAQRRFVANASHELRTPLAMMRTTLDVAVAKPGGVPTQTRELDAELRVDLDRADQLLEGFLALARAQNGQLGERNHVALEPLIRSALSDAADQIAAKELTVETDLDGVEVAGSPTLLRRMIENVIENAVRHTNAGGLVEIALASSDGRQARVVIASSGPVLDPAAVAQLAQPFKRLCQDRIESQDGHGLGLSIVAAVATAHGGQLDLHAPAEGGLRVHITLPAVSLSQLAQAAR